MNYGKYVDKFILGCTLLLLPLVITIHWNDVQGVLNSIVYDQYISARQQEHEANRQALLENGQLTEISEDYQIQLIANDLEGYSTDQEFSLQSAIAREGILKMFVEASPSDLNWIASNYDLNPQSLISSIENFPPSLSINDEPFVYLDNAKVLIESNADSVIHSTFVEENHDYISFIREFELSDSNVLTNNDAFEQLLQIGGSLMVYQNLFPPQSGVGGTALHNLPSGLSAKGYNIGEINVNANFIRARSFGGLRGFGRVGGVLIGNPPQNENSLDIVNFEWEVTEDNIIFILTDSSGNVWVTEKFPVSIAYYALNYAADGRPTATTMTSAPPIRELKILVHPALVDTPMGYRSIEIDRFVDTYYNDTPRFNAEYSICSIDALYDYVWHTRINLLVENLNTQKGLNIPQNTLEEILAEEPSYNCDPRYAYDELGDRIGDPNYSVIEAQKGEFYDEDLVNLINMTISETNSFDDFENKIAAELNEVVSTVPYAYAWFYPPPEYEVISGVRERDYTLETYNFIPFENTSNSPAEEIPLDFILQVFFTTPKYYAGCNGLEDEKESIENCFDHNPWELPWLHDEVHSETLSALNNNSEHAQILEDMIAFTYLQRLFRAGFNGDLGLDLPLYKFLILSEELGTKFDNNYYRTLKWNTYPIDFSFGWEKELRFQLGIWMDRLQVGTESLPPFD